MRIIETKVYPFDELSDDAKETAVQELWDTNVDYDWYDGVINDAEEAKLKLTEFELDRGSYCKGEFIEYAKDTADAIIGNHGENCETRKTAMEFLAASALLCVEYPVKLDDDGYDDNECLREDAQEDIDSEFLKSILEDYRIILQKEYEYLTSEETIIETIKANEYEFTEGGKLI